MNAKKILAAILLLVGIFNIGRGQPVDFPPYVIENQSWYLQQHSDIIKTIVPIVSPGQADRPVRIFDDADIEFISGQYIRLQDGFTASGFEAGYFKGFVQDPGIDAVIFHPTETPGKVEKFDKFEIGVSLPEAIDDQITEFLEDLYFQYDSINPYDEDQIDMIAVFTHGQTQTMETRFGFYYRDYEIVFDDGIPEGKKWQEKSTVYNGKKYNWRIRFAPELVGDWTCDITITSPYFSQIEINGLSFTCVCTPSQCKKDFLSVGNNGKHLWHEDTQEYEFLSGMNVMFIPDTDPPIFRPSKVDKMESYIDSLIDYRSNYIGTAMINIWDWDNNNSNQFRPICSYGIEWERLGVYDKFTQPNYEIINNRQVNAWCLDKRFEKCENNGVYQKFALLTHDAFNYSDLSAWDHNPYRTLLDTKAAKEVEFFTNSDVKAQFKKYLRYVIARWGYSTSIAYYFLIYEADKLLPLEHSSGDEQEMNEAVKIWFEEMSEYVKELDNNHLISGAYASLPENENENFFSDGSSADLVLMHKYTSLRLQNKKRLDDMAKDDNFFYGRPSGYSEVSTQTPQVDECHIEPFHQTIWATAFMRNFGTLHWSWDKLQALGGHKQYRPLYQFFEQVDISKIFSFGYDWDASWPGCSIWPGDHNRNYEVFYVRSRSTVNDEISSYAWVNNLSYYWYNLYGSTCTGGAPSDDDCYSGVHFNDTKLKIEGMTKGRFYVMDYYYTGKDDPDPANEWNLTYYTSYLIGPIPNHGSLKFRPKGPLMAAYANGYYSDLACAITPDPGREFENITYDTLDCYMDTIFCSGYYFDDYDTVLNYHWHFGNGQESDEVWPAIHYDTTGNYALTLYVSDGNTLLDSLVCYMTVLDCDTTGGMKSSEGDNGIGKGSGLEYENGEFKITYFPNPTNGILNLEVAGGYVPGPYDILIYNIYGTPVYSSFTVMENIRSIDLSSFSKGVYYLKVSFNGQSRTGKVILE